MNKNIIPLLSGAIMMLAVQACSSTGTSGGGGSGGTTDPSSTTDASSTTDSSASASTGGETDCMTTTPTPPTPCPDPSEGHKAYLAMLDDCKMYAGIDLDTSNPKNVTLKASGKVKLCATCVCQQTATNFHAFYTDCPDGADAALASFAKNVHTLVDTCP